LYNRRNLNSSVGSSKKTFNFSTSIMVSNPTFITVLVFIAQCAKIFRKEINQ
ncbi:hypothetical protein L9F63_014967, partial [Diploptera punctata]